MPMSPLQNLIYTEKLQSHSILYMYMQAEVMSVLSFGNTLASISRRKKNTDKSRKEIMCIKVQTCTSKYDFQARSREYGE